MKLTAEELSYRARALAQAHPLTALAKRYLDRAVAQQRLCQPIPEIGIWAGASLLNGYCLRCVEENDADVLLAAATDDSAFPDLDQLDDLATQVAAELRSETGNRHILGDDGVFDALDRIINSEVNNRLGHWRDTIDDDAWAEMEEYITWWVVKGYALRVAETMTGALV